MTTANSRGKSFEYNILYKLRTLYPNAYRIPSSGASSNLKGDLRAGNFFIECKKTMHNSYRLTNDLLKKTESDAKDAKLIPAIVFSVKNTKPYIVLSLENFMELMKNGELKKTR